MELGTRIDATIESERGHLQVETPDGTYAARLLDPEKTLNAGGQIRMRLNLEPVGGEPNPLGTGILLVGQVVLEADQAVQPLLPGGQFSMDVQRLTRGIIAGEFSRGPENTHTVAEARAATESAKTVFDSIPPMLNPLSSEFGLPEGAVEVVVCGESGELAIRHHQDVFSAWLLRIPDDFQVGQELHLRMVIPPPPGSDAHEEHAESVDLLGRVLALVDADDAGELEYHDGSRIVFAVVKHLGGDIPIPLVDEGNVAGMIDQLSAPAPIELPPTPEATLAPPAPTSTPAPGYSADDAAPSLEGDAEVNGLGLSKEGAPLFDPMGMPSGIVGNISQMSLIDLMQTLNLNRKTARVDVHLDREGQVQGVIFVRDGQLVGAGTADLDGEEAFFSLVRAAQGTFRVRFDRKSPEENIDADTTYLLLEAMRRLDDGEATVATPQREKESLATGSAPWGDAVGDFTQDEPSKEFGKEFAEHTEDVVEQELEVDEADVVEATMLEPEGTEPADSANPVAARPEGDLPSLYDDSLDDDSDVTREEPLRIRASREVPGQDEAPPPITVPGGGGSIFASFFEEARLATGEDPNVSGSALPSPLVTDAGLDEMLLSEDQSGVFSGYSDSISSPPS
jgi:hypothetical protein